jgi:hypothetical protein
MKFASVVLAQEIAGYFWAGVPWTRFSHGRFTLLTANLTDPTTPVSSFSEVTDSGFVRQTVPMDTTFWGAVFTAGAALDLSALNFGTAAAGIPSIVAMVVDFGATRSPAVSNEYFYADFPQSWSVAAGSPIVIPAGLVKATAGQPVT